MLGLGAAVPDNRYDQMRIADSLAPASNSHRVPAIFWTTEIKARHCLIDDLDWLVAHPSNGVRLLTSTFVARIVSSIRRAVFLSW
jgi:hypothetical protein